MMTTSLCAERHSEKHIDNVDGTDPAFTSSADALAYGKRFKSAEFSDEALLDLPHLAGYKGERLKIQAVAVVNNTARGSRGRNELQFRVFSTSSPLFDGHFFAGALTRLSTREASQGARTQACARAAALAGPSSTSLADEQLVFDLRAHLLRQIEISGATFGPGDRLARVCDQIRKELAEVEKSGSALARWIEVITLAIDAAWRSGATAEQIVDALQAKHAT